MSRFLLERKAAFKIPFTGWLFGFVPVIHENNYGFTINIHKTKEPVFSVNCHHVFLPATKYIPANFTGYA
jgi:hypothetical protein